MDEFIQHNCRLWNLLPLIYVSVDYLHWFSHKLNKPPNYITLLSQDEIELCNSNGETMVLYLIQLQKRSRKKNKGIRLELEYIINTTKYSLPWISDSNIYSSESNFNLVMNQISADNLDQYIINVHRMDVEFIDTHKIYVIEFNITVPPSLIAKLENNPNLFSLHIKYAYTWHQSWTIQKTPFLDEVCLDMCAEEWKFEKLLEILDIFDLISLQIAIRGSTINQYLNLHIKKLIRNKLDGIPPDVFDLDHYLFENCKEGIRIEAFIYFCYEYGRSFKKIIVGEWNFMLISGQMSQRSLEIVLKDINRQLEYHKISQLYLKSELHELEKLLNTINQSKQLRAVEITGKQINSYTLYHLLLSEYIECIQINLGEKHEFNDPKTEFNFDLTDLNHTIKNIYIQNIQSDCQVNEVDMFLQCLRSVLAGRKPEQPPYIHLIFTEVIIKDFLIFQSLPINEISFNNMELSWQNFVDLGKCTNIEVTDLNFRNCRNLTDQMLFKVLVNRNFKFEKILIEGETAITPLIYYLFAEDRLLVNNAEEFEHILETIHVEQFKEYSWQRYKINKQLNMIEILDRPSQDDFKRDMFEFYN